MAWLERWISLIPWSMRGIFYKNRYVAGFMRQCLNRIVGSGRRQSTVTGGPLAGVKLELDLQTEKHFWLGTHEVPLQDWFVANVEYNWIVYDIGAHLGYFTVLASRLVKDGQVFSFEPDPDNVKRLYQNLSLNAINNVNVISSAVTVQSGSITMAIRRETMSHVIDTTHDDRITCRDECRIEAVSLDDFVLKRGNPVPHLLKIDVEDHEGHVLRGALELLNKYKPVIVCEIHSLLSGQAVCDILIGAGYSIFSLEDEYAQVLTTKEICSSHIVARATDAVST